MDITADIVVKTEVEDTCSEWEGGAQQCTQDGIHEAQQSTQDGMDGAQQYTQDGIDEAQQYTQDGIDRCIKIEPESISNADKKKVGKRKKRLLSLKIDPIIASQWSQMSWEDMMKDDKISIILTKQIQDIMITNSNGISASEMDFFKYLLKIKNGVKEDINLNQVKVKVKVKTKLQMRDERVELRYNKLLDFGFTVDDAKKICHWSWRAILDVALHRNIILEIVKERYNTRNSQRNCALMNYQNLISMQKRNEPGRYGLLLEIGFDRQKATTWAKYPWEYILKDNRRATDILDRLELGVIALIEEINEISSGETSTKQKADIDVLADKISKRLEFIFAHFLKTDPSSTITDYYQTNSRNSTEIVNKLCNYYNSVSIPEENNIALSNSGGTKWPRNEQMNVYSVSQVNQKRQIDYATSSTAKVSNVSEAPSGNRQTNSTSHLNPQVSANLSGIRETPVNNSGNTTSQGSHIETYNIAGSSTLPFEGNNSTFSRNAYLTNESQYRSEQYGLEHAPNDTAAYGSNIIPLAQSPSDFNTGYIGDDMNELLQTPRQFNSEGSLGYNIASSSKIDSQYNYSLPKRMCTYQTNIDNEPKRQKLNPILEKNKFALFAMTPVSYPWKKLYSFHLKLLQQLITDLLMATPDPLPKIIVDHKIENGVVYVKCGDFDSALWVMENLNNVFLDDLQVKVKKIQSTEPTNVDEKQGEPIKMVWKSYNLDISDKDALVLLNRLNPELQTEKWKIIYTIPGSNFVERIVFMDQVSAEFIEAHSYCLPGPGDLCYFKLVRAPS